MAMRDYRYIPAPPATPVRGALARRAAVLAAALLRRPAYLVAGLVLAALACWLLVAAWNGDETAGDEDAAVVQPAKPVHPIQPEPRAAAPAVAEGEEAPPQAEPAAVPASAPYVPVLASAIPTCPSPAAPGCTAPPTRCG